MERKENQAQRLNIVENVFLLRVLVNTRNRATLLTFLTTNCLPSWCTHTNWNKLLMGKGNET
jgi:hypothetical protein